MDLIKEAQQQIDEGLKTKKIEVLRKLIERKQKLESYIPRIEKRRVLIDELLLHIASDKVGTAEALEKITKFDLNFKGIFSKLSSEE